MIRREANLLIVAFVALLLTACHDTKKGGASDGKEIGFRYAQLIKIWEYEGYRKLEIQNPWDSSQILQTYLLVDRNTTAQDLPKGTVIRTPLERSVIFTTVHCGLVHELGAEQAIAGVCDLEYIAQPSIKERCQRGEVANLGSSMSPDKERMIDLAPDAILLSPFENSGGHGGLEQLGIPIFECADYMENEALGRAEWMRLYGMLFGREAEADSIFHEVETAFNALKMKAEERDTDQRPTLLYGFRYGSSWYVPGGESYMAKIFKSAGANYLFAETTHQGAKPFAFETVFDRGFEADLWLFLYNEKENRTYRDLSDYAAFKSYKERKIYACNTGKIPYYDEIPFHPERLLSDLSLLFLQKNEAIDESKLRYFSNLAE